MEYRLWFSKKLAYTLLKRPLINENNAKKNSKSIMFEGSCLVSRLLELEVSHKDGVIESI